MPCSFFCTDRTPWNEYRKKNCKYNERELQRVSCISAGRMIIMKKKMNKKRSLTHFMGESNVAFVLCGLPKGCCTFFASFRFGWLCLFIKSIYCLWPTTNSYRKCFNSVLLMLVGWFFFVKFTPNKPALWNLKKQIWEIAFVCSFSRSGSCWRRGQVTEDLRHSSDSEKCSHIFIFLSTRFFVIFGNAVL